MSLQLYYSPGACSFVPHALLEASGAAFEPVPVRLHKNEQHGAEYLKVNPHAQVPALKDGAQVITQIIAICDWLDRRFPEAAFFPAGTRERAQAMATLAWMNNTVHPTFTHVFMPHKFTDEPALQAGLKAFNLRRYGELLDELQTLVEAAGARGEPWLAGANFGPLDAYALTLARWGTLAGLEPQQRPALWSFVEQRVAAHPPVAAVLERERVPLNLYRPPSAA